MQKDGKVAGQRRIDLSNCKLLLPYGRNAAADLKVESKVGTINKIGVINKIGGIIKTGFIGKPGIAR